MALCQILKQRFFGMAKARFKIIWLFSFKTSRCQTSWFRTTIETRDMAFPGKKYGVFYNGSRRSLANFCENRGIPSQKTRSKRRFLWLGRQKYVLNFCIATAASCPSGTSLLLHPLLPERVSLKFISWKGTVDCHRKMACCRLTEHDKSSKFPFPCITGFWNRFPAKFLTKL